MLRPCDECFGTGVLALQSVTSWSQNWSSGTPEHHLYETQAKWWCPKKQMRNSGLHARHQCPAPRSNTLYRYVGAWCQNTGEFWDGGFGATVSHLMVPELEQWSARALPARNRSKMVVPFPVKNKICNSGLHARHQCPVPCSNTLYLGGMVPEH